MPRGRPLAPKQKAEKPWRQLALVLGEAGLALLSSGLVFIIISRVSGPEALGTYALALGWLMLFQGISSFGVPELIMREVGAYGRAAAGQVLHAILLGLASSFIGVCLMAIAARLPGYSPYLVDAITIASLALIPALLNSACRSVFLALREMHFAFLAALVETTIVTCVSLWLLAAGYGAIALIVTLLAAKLASASISLTLLRRNMVTQWPAVDFGLLEKTARAVYSFGIGGVLSMLTMRINTVLASVWVDIASLGHFAAATKVMEIGLIIPGLFVQLLMTRASYSFNTKDDRDPNRFGAWYQVLFALVVPVAIGGWVFAGLVLEILFGKAFADAAWILRILMVYLLVESVDAVVSVFLKAAQRQREDATLLAFNPLTNIALSLVLLPILGTIGAAIGRVGGACTSATLRNLLINRELTKVSWLRFAAKPALISAGMGAVCYWLLGADRMVSLFLYMAGTVILLGVSSSFSLSTVKDMMSVSPSQE
jgi:O-antigen/teichoic acid export membrane protein